MEGQATSDRELNRMGQFEFSKGLMEKILRRAFLDGVIELYENCPFGRIYSVALEGDLSLTINKYETFDIRLFEIAQRAPAKPHTAKMIKSEPSSTEASLKKENIKPEIKFESNHFTSPNNKSVTYPDSDFPTAKVQDSNKATECSVLSTAEIDVSNTSTSVQSMATGELVSKDELVMISEGVSGERSVSIGEAINKGEPVSISEAVSADEPVSTGVVVSARESSSTHEAPDTGTASVVCSIEESSESGPHACGTSSEAGGIYDDGLEKDVTDDENLTELKLKTPELEVSDENDVECELIDPPSKVCETIFIDDEEEIITKGGRPEFLSTSKVKRRRKHPRRGIHNSVVSPTADVGHRSGSPADSFYSACPLCSALFQNRDCFIMHVQAHRHQLGRTCLICSQGNLQTEGYLYHLATHHGTSIIQAAADLSGLGREGLASASSRQPQFPVVKSEGEFRCLQCGRDFLTIGMLESHAESHRLEDLEAEQEMLHAEKLESKDMMTYGCELCSDVFANPGSLADHHRQEHGLQVKGQMSLYVNDHTDDSSSEDAAAVITHKCMDVFTCHRCGRSFRSWRSLKYHYLTTHGLQYTCEVCRNAFSSQRHLQVHEETHVSTLADPVFKCNICDKTFPTVTHCTAHKRSHTSAKPHTCDLCGSCFFKRGDLTKHVRTVHCPKKHFVCKICGRTGTRSDNMRVHVKLHQKFMSRDQVDQLIEEVYNK
ncbi:zinc finger and SCAN domain-containing protein 2-like [Gigantopelta aegis]|uniref:zinc finger and SCAN domain-containing protein 2-like n=1 Tax=Gigantopelta aegis TaxID=1735272 RepID=UPI001B88C7E5|nr:zinc finger and SCAN domain-containing protein 2-like [Gigantopelta aegis]